MMRILTIAAAAATIGLSATTSEAAEFNFAGYTFNDGGPSSASSVVNPVLDNVSTFGIGQSFNGNSVGQLLGGPNPSAISLGDPNVSGNDGAVDFSYATPVSLRGGADFVIFESGSKSGFNFGVGSGFEGFTMLLNNPGFPPIPALLNISEATGFVDVAGNQIPANDNSGTTGFFYVEVDVDDAFSTSGLPVPASIDGFTIQSIKNATGYTFSTGSRDPDIAFVGTVVPEPTAVLGGLALTGLVGLRRRQATA
jgi:hypothetical protein